jgi:DNA-binding CsgD family transcriptional regulator
MGDDDGAGAADSYLSYREIDVLRLMAAGLTNRQVPPCCT